MRHVLTVHEGLTIVSGDYSAATDYLNLDSIRTVASALQERLLSLNHPFSVPWYTAVDDELIETNSLRLGE